MVQHNRTKLHRLGIPAIRCHLGAEDWRRRKDPRAEINLAPSRGKMPPKPSEPAFWRPLWKNTRERIKMARKTQSPSWDSFAKHSAHEIGCIFLRRSDVRPVEIALPASRKLPDNH